MTDYEASTIQVFSEEGNHLYNIPTAVHPLGIALTEEYIFVSAEDQLAKIRKSNNKSVKSVQTKKCVWGIDIDGNNNIYGCEVSNLSVIVFDNNLKFLKIIKLKTFHINSYSGPNSIKLYKDSMYVMFVGTPFPLQTFSLEGELERCLIPKSQIGYCYFFSLDRLGNIIVADTDNNRIKIFSKEGVQMHTINMICYLEIRSSFVLYGVAVDRKNRIIVAHQNKECNLVAF